MATKKDRVIVRDGSAGLGGPRPRPVPKPWAPAEAKNVYVKGSGDPQGIKGSFSFADAAAGVHSNRSADCGRAGFEALPGGERSPRQRAAAGESGFGEHVTPDRSEELIRKPAPLS
jgi:hypothetical protein